MLPGASACYVCGERDHKSSKCPCLHSPLTPGFYSGGGGHSHDDDDESLKTKIILNKSQRFHNFIYSSTKNSRAAITQPNTSVHMAPHLA